MKQIKFIAMCGLAAGLTGCGGSESESVMVPPPTAAPAVETAAPVAVPEPPPAPVAPPPAATDNAALPAAAEKPVEFTTVDSDGKPVPALEFMNMAIDGYERTRASMTEGETWPPITNVNQLIEYRILSRLPAPPAGQQFVLNPATGKVALAPK